MKKSVATQIDLHPIECGCSLCEASAHPADRRLTPLDRVSLQILAGFLVAHALIWIVDHVIDGPGAFALFGWAR